MIKYGDELLGKILMTGSDDQSNQVKGSIRVDNQQLYWITTWQGLMTVYFVWYN